MERNAEKKKHGLNGKLPFVTCGRCGHLGGGEDTAAKLNYERRELTEGKKGITKGASYARI